tara:strand:+ start:269 stop:940 length:672 start_codon:yes stop_codon:yes gene_type:complete
MKRQLKGLALEEYKVKLPKFNQTQKNIIIGTLLGDSTLQRSKALKPLHNIKFEQKPENESYIDQIYREFFDWCGTPPQFYVKKSGLVKSYWFKTYGHRSFDFYANQFYKIDEKDNGKRVKVVPKLVHRWFNPEVLAYWFMDDGSKSGSAGYYLNTQNFTLRENKHLADALGKVFKFEVNVHVDNNYLTGKKGYRLYITSKSRDEFTEMIYPYTNSCFYYKLIR